MTGHRRAFRDHGRDNPESAAPAVYRERLRTPLWWYPVAVGVAVLLAAQFHLAGLPLTDWIPYGVMVPLAVLVVWSLGRNELVIDSEELRVRSAHISLRYLTGAIALEPTILRRLVGREGDPAAFISIRSWIGPGVQVLIDDPDDPTPYWVISSRHPEEVARRLRRSG